MKKLILGLLVFGLTSQLMQSQGIELAEVRLEATNYEYLDATRSEDVAVPVRKLQKKVADYNLEEARLYPEEYEFLQVSYFIPNGRIDAAYDNEGIIIRTVERFENMQLPRLVYNSIKNKYPDWDVINHLYKVRYFGKSGTVLKQYKVKLENENERVTLRFDDDGETL